MSSKDNNVIEFKNVSLAFNKGKKEFKAIKNASFKIKEGEFVALIGESGAGKTTILNLIASEYKATDGYIKVADYRLDKLSKKEIRFLNRTLGFVFQDYDLVERSTVINNVLMAKVPGSTFNEKTYKAFPPEVKEEAYEILESLDILEQSHKKARELSGGQKQRVALARSILSNAYILLADEPVSALDPVMLKQVMDLLRKDNLEKGRTTVANLHHIEVALQYADRIIGIRKGEIVFDGPTSKITMDDIDNIYGGKVKGLSQKQLEFAKKKNLRK